MGFGMLALQTAQDLEDVRREVAVMKLLRGHPDIVHLKDTYEDSAVCPPRPSLGGRGGNGCWGAGMGGWDLEGREG